MRRLNLMSKDDFLARCALAYDVDLITPTTIGLLDVWIDMVMRYEGSLSPLGGQQQLNYFRDILEDEAVRTEGFKNVLVSDVEGYKVIKLIAIFSHPCQICATDKDAWWTRPEAVALLEDLYNRELRARSRAEAAWIADISPCADGGPPKWIFMSDYDRTRQLSIIRTMQEVEKQR